MGTIDLLSHTRVKSLVVGFGVLLHEVTHHLEDPEYYQEFGISVDLANGPGRTNQPLWKEFSDIVLSFVCLNPSLLSGYNATISGPGEYLQCIKQETVLVIGNRFRETDTQLVKL